MSKVRYGKLSELNNSMVRVCYWFFLGRMVVAKRSGHSPLLQSPTIHNSDHKNFIISAAS
jgi:hypothetical protein